MQTFPASSELQFLVGEELSQVCIDPWSLKFHFDSACHITVEGRIEHVDEAGDVHSHYRECSNGAPIYLHQLLQHKIASIRVEPLCLSLIFDNGAILRIYTEEGPYECGQIYQADMKDGPIVFDESHDALARLWGLSVFSLEFQKDPIGGRYQRR